MPFRILPLVACVLDTPARARVLKANPSTAIRHGSRASSLVGLAPFLADEGPSAAGAASAKARTARVPENRTDGSHLHFLITADWGGLPKWPWVTPGQQKVAASLGRLASARRSAFALSLGDHFYADGVQSVEDPRWRQTFELAYSAKALQGEGFWRIVAGNHDHKGNMSAQLAYAARDGARWRYPALQHSWTEVLDADGAGDRGTAGAGGGHERRPSAGAEKEVVAGFILIDTVLLCGMGSVHFKPLPESTTRMWGDRDSHWAWLEATLGQMKHADYIVVGERLELGRGTRSGYIPRFSPYTKRSGGHGSAYGVSALTPLLRPPQVATTRSSRRRTTARAAASARASTRSFCTMASRSIFQATTTRCSTSTAQSSINPRRPPHCTAWGLA